MKYVTLDEHGSPDVLHLAEGEAPVPGIGEVLIKVHASGVNRPDISQREGNYPPPPGISSVIGLEVSGEIVSGDLSGNNPLGLSVGDKVCALVAGGGYAEYCVAPVGQCLPVPEGLTTLEAATLPETYFTVWTNLFDRANLGKKPDGRLDTLLVHGASSGIGVAAVQLGVAMGHRVFGTAGTAEKCAFVENLGAEHCINYRESDFADAVLERTDGEGVDVVLDIVAGDYINEDIRCMAFDGRLSMIAVLGGSSTNVDLLTFLFKRLTMTASTLRARQVDFKTDIALSLHQNVWPLFSAQKIKPRIFRVFSPEQAANAHRLMESNAHLGKLVIDWRNS